MPDLTSVHPVSDVSLWVRFLLGGALVLWLPGYLLAGRHLVRRSAATRMTCSIGIGALLLPIWSEATSLFGLGIRPLEYLPVILILTGAIGLAPPGRRLGEALDAQEAEPAWLAAAVLGSAAIVFACIAVGFDDFVVPPSTHDGANHAFMTLRITQTGTVSASQVFGAPYGQPDLPYTMGLHAIASMIAQTSGLAPYVSVWFLAIAAITLLPASLAILWNEWRLPTVAIALATLFVAANPFVPARLLWWGLFGTAAGLFLVPICALLLERFWSSATPLLGVSAGVASGSLMLIHGSEVPTAGLVALATILLLRRPPVWALSGWITFFGTGILCGWHFLAGVVPSYLNGGIEGGDEFFETLGMTLENSLGAIAAWPGLRILVVAGLILGVREKRTRVLALFALGLLLVVTTLGLFRDPISGLLTTPFYRQPERTRYLFVFFAPALMGAALLWVWERLRAPEWPVAAQGFAAALGLGLLVAPELPGIVEGFETKREFAPFSDDDFRQASQIAERLGPDDWIVNQFFDGSSWAMHLSGRRFLVPTGWRMTPPGAEPNQQTLRRIMRSQSFSKLDPNYRYLYVSDLRTGRPRGFIRRRIEADLRFEPVLVGEHSTLYRIRREQSR